jgi:hypothetical protein
MPLAESVASSGDRRNSSRRAVRIRDIVQELLRPIGSPRIDRRDHGDDTPQQGHAGRQLDEKTHGLDLSCDQRGKERGSATGIDLTGVDGAAKL